MTRINLVHPTELTDQHLMAESREIKMVDRALTRSLKASWQKRYDIHEDSDRAAKEAVADVINRIPRKFTLNTGHVMFFYDKGAYLRKRLDDIMEELEYRGYERTGGADFDVNGIFTTYPELNGDYTPTEEALALVRSRIGYRVSEKPQWYRYYGQPLTDYQSRRIMSHIIR